MCRFMTSTISHRITVQREIKNSHNGAIKKAVIKLRVFERIGILTKDSQYWNK